MIVQVAPGTLPSRWPRIVGSMRPEGGWRTIAVESIALRAQISTSSRFRLCSAASVGGTFVNDVRVQSAFLKAGDVVRLGGAERFVVELEMGPAAAGSGRHSATLAREARAEQQRFSAEWKTRMLLTGERVPAKELYRLGVVEECVPAGELMGKSRELAAEIAGKSPLAVRMIKESFNAVENLTLRDGYRRWQTRLEKDGIDPVAATVVRLAVDGLWFGAMIGVPPLAPRLRKGVLAFLEQLSGSKARR